MPDISSFMAKKERRGWLTLDDLEGLGTVETIIRSTRLAGAFGDVKLIIKFEHFADPLITSPGGMIADQLAKIRDPDSENGERDTDKWEGMSVLIDKDSFTNWQGETVPCWRFRSTSD